MKAIRIIEIDDANPVIETQLAEITYPNTNFWSVAKGLGMPDPDDHQAVADYLVQHLSREVARAMQAQKMRKVNKAIENFDLMTPEQQSMALAQLGVPADY